MGEWIFNFLFSLVEIQWVRTEKEFKKIKKVLKERQALMSAAFHQQFDNIVTNNNNKI